ncbi:MAG: class I SAM-dependent methyltransferase [Spirochaetia bacterium]|nr:class I SAM-dependent methyltransferase [Spirochaetia bacterium]
MSDPLNLEESFGDIDVYLFDQLLKGRLHSEMSVLDAGCGGGRNLIYFLKNGFNVFGIDASTTAISQTRALAASLAPRLPADHFRVEALDKLKFHDETFDFIICNAVLHFAQNEDHWSRMVKELWRVLKKEGVLFARLASSVAIENQISSLGEGRYRLPDGSERYLVNPEMLLITTASLGGELMDPIKSVVVHEMRTMTNWVLKKV